VFAGLIKDAKSAAGGLIGKYLARASVGVPFIVALGFSLAATTVMLVECPDPTSCTGPVHEALTMGAGTRNRRAPTVL
jgi:dienelactone hydrolase